MEDSRQSRLGGSEQTDRRHGDVAWEDTNPAPETKTKLELSEWARANGLRVGWEHQNGFGFDVFHVNGSPQKPDLLIRRPGGYTVAVETKQDHSKSSTYDALLQTHEYWLDYITGKREYSLGDKEVDIDGFVVGNGHSRNGRLFYDSIETLLGYDDFSEGRQRAVEMGELPPREYSMTEMYTRIQWRLAKKATSNIDTGIGALLSTALNPTTPGRDPAVLWWHDDTQGWVIL